MPANTRLFDDTDPVMAGLSLLASDEHATDRQRAIADMAQTEILRLRQQATRDFFAAHALSGLIAQGGTGGPAAERAERAYQYADAMLTWRSK
jgi:hypothetical protein